MQTHKPLVYPKQQVNPQIKRIHLFLWLGYLIFSPFYVFNSGLPQPADFIVVLLIGLSFVSNWNLILPFFKKPISNLKSFVIYVVIVNTLWFYFIDQTNEKPIPSIFHSLFYIFNFFVFRLVILLYQRFTNQFLKYTILSIGFSMVFQVLLAILMGAITSRDPIFFNNPNQLGYYALLSGTIVSFISSKVNINKLFLVLFYGSFFTLSLISASKAAIAGSFFLVILTLIDQGILKLKINTLIFFALTIYAGYFVIVNTEIGSALFGSAADRFLAIGEQNDDSIEGRGYDRIINDPEYLIFGAGEGGYYRFDTAIVDHEIHSSFGTILFCYGIIGFYFFMRFLRSIFKLGDLMYFLYSLPVFIYSLTHQGLRNTLFWVLLAFILVVNFEKYKSKVELKFKKYVWMQQMKKNKEGLQKMNT